jgi:hypothetical protein
MGPRAKAAIALPAIVVVVLVGLLIWSTAQGGTAKSTGRETGQARRGAVKAPPAQTGRAPREAAKKHADSGRHVSRPSSTPGRSTHRSFAALERDIPGQIGLAYAPLGATESQRLGPLQVGHAWSSLKVPIVVTLALEQEGALTSSQESLATAAITASDNEAAAALFSELEGQTGGNASQAVERTLAKAPGGATQVATAPPPPGAVSSWGQTEWSLSASNSFYGALACGAFGGVTPTVLRDMENVIAEQQWGLGQASLPEEATVAFKAGWGPDGSVDGPYLVRQAAIIRSADGGAVVTIAAQDSSGSFDAGVEDLDRLADWVAKNVPLSGSC